jgi:hypothetical protein
VGYALGTADLLGQMSDHRYIEKLPLLFLEFKEAYNYEGTQPLVEMKIQQFTSEKELIQNTPNFFTTWVRKRLEDMGAIHHLLEDPETGQNPYLKKIQENMDTISSMYF